MERMIPVLDSEATGRNIKMLMKLKGISIKEIQEFLRLSTTQSVYHWLSGRNMPSIDNLYALSELFHLPVDVLIKGSRSCQFLYFENPMLYRTSLYQEEVSRLLRG